MVQTLGATEGAEFRGGLLAPARSAPDFTLPTADGREFRLSAQRGHVVALSFGYTSCPDVCPTTLAELVQVRSRLGESGKRLRIVFITVDPERDSPARLAEYARAFSGGFTALSGTADALARLRKAYGVVAEKRVIRSTGAGYLIDHSSFVYVVDPDGKLRLMFPFGIPLEITVLNPMGFPPKVTAKPLAPRLSTLDGKTVYLVDCRFDDSDVFLKQMQARLAEHLPGVRTVFKPTRGRRSARSRGPRSCAPTPTR